MTDPEFLQRKLREIAEARRVMLQLRLDNEERRAAQPLSEGSSIVEPAAEFVLDELDAALREMGRFYLRISRSLETDYAAKPEANQ